MDAHVRGKAWRQAARNTARSPSHAATSPKIRTIQKILVPLDGSDIAQGVIPDVVAIARTFDAEVLLLSVIEQQPNAWGADSADWRLARAVVRAGLDDVVRRLDTVGIHAQPALSDGRASEQILRFAEECGADLIAMCSHGRGGITDFNLSGTVSKVLRRAGCSVLVARAHTPGALPPATKYDHVLAPVDCSMQSKWAVHVAAAIAQKNSAELVLGTVVARPEVLGDAEAHAEARPLVNSLIELNRRVAARHLLRLTKEVAGERLTVRTLVIDGEHVGRAIDRLAESENCSLIVLAAHGRVPDTDWPFGSVPNLLLEHSSRSVLVLQDLARNGMTRRANSPARSVTGLPSGWT